MELNIRYDYNNANINNISVRLIGIQQYEQVKAGQEIFLYTNGRYQCNCLVLAKISQDIDKIPRWIYSLSLGGWGDELDAMTEKLRKAGMKKVNFVLLQRTTVDLGIYYAQRPEMHETPEYKNWKEKQGV